MEIRIVEGRRIMNVSRIEMKVEGKYIIGIEEGGRVIRISERESEERAKEEMGRIIEEIREGISMRRKEILIDIEERGRRKEK